MNSKFLIAHRYKVIGWLIILSGIFIHIFSNFTNNGREIFSLNTFAIYVDGIDKKGFFQWYHTDMSLTLVLLFLSIGGLLIIFSKEKQEDEFINHLRLNSFQWSILINYIIFIFLNVFIYGMFFLSIIFFQIFGIILIFIARFQYLLYQYKKHGYEK